ncbi:MAG: dihydropteroate synthase [Terrimicrobiaceae bacterium]|nr:dihydropteroate synthase [Terrimicrobiaceae bacterium]
MRTVLEARGRRVAFPRRPLIMGILNINDDSFSGDGRVDARWALGRARDLAELGADIVDVGAESARTNRPPISPEEETGRLQPFLEGFAAAIAGARRRDETQIFPPLLSVNTWRPEVAEAALAIAGDILNDMGGLPAADNARICAENGAALVIMHTVGLPKEKHTHVTYEDVVGEVLEFFEVKVAMAREAGLRIESTILDPGLDFAKSGSANLEILRRLRELGRLGRPLLLPISRKSFIGRALGIEDPRERDPATAACAVQAAMEGAGILRIHDVDMAWHVLNTLEKLGLRD